MAEIIQFRFPSKNRREFIFKVKKIKVTTQEVKLVSIRIVLYHGKTKRTVSCPGFERWFEIDKGFDLTFIPFEEQAKSLCKILNNILWFSSRDSIQATLPKWNQKFFLL